METRSHHVRHCRQPCGNHRSIRGGAALREGRIQDALALYEPDAVFIAQPGAQPLSGREAIRDALTEFAAPVRYFQSIIAIELAVAVALLFQVRYFDKDATAGQHPILGSACSWRPCSLRLCLAAWRRCAKAGAPWPRCS